MDKSMIGLIGESFLVMELAKRNIRAYKLPSQFDYDFLLSNNLKIEVKTANITIGKKKYKDKEYTWERWMFNLNQRIDGHKRPTRNCDYYVLICLNKNQEVEQSFIIPSKVLGKREVACIYNLSGKYGFQYENPNNRGVIKKNKVTTIRNRNPFFIYKNRWDLITEKSSFT